MVVVNHLFEMVRVGILEDAANGKLKPDEAEAKAKSAGLSPLRPVPSPERYDPRQISHWSLPMVIAWIVWRTVDRVRDQWDVFRSISLFWASHYVQKNDEQTGEPRETECFVLRGCEPASVFDLMLDEACSPDNTEIEKCKLKSVRMARIDLWNQLGLGHLDASAVWVRSSLPKQIEAFEWRYIRLIQVNNEDILTYAHDPLSHVYSRVYFDPRQVMKLWPALKMSAMQKRDAKSRCDAWFEGVARASIHKPTMTKPEFLERSKSEFGMGTPTAERIWNDVTLRLGATAWRAGGRRPKTGVGKISTRK